MDAITRDVEMVDSVRWALSRMVELRSTGQTARFRVTYADREGRREFRLEVRRADGRIERPPYPFPLTGSGARAVEESDEKEFEARVLPQVDGARLDIEPLGLVEDRSIEQQRADGDG